MYVLTLYQYLCMYSTYVCMYRSHFCSRPSAVSFEVVLSNKSDCAFVDIMWHAFSPPCCIAGDHVKWQWQPPPPGLVKGCPCSMDRNQSWPANPYTHGTGLQFRKRLYILRGRSNSATPVCSVRYPRIKPPKVDPGSFWFGVPTWDEARRCHVFRHGPFLPLPHHRD